ncbi:hypothetical protein FIV38_27735 [Pseudomonas proteolytica]|nr:hypothetical protein F4W61_26630 [Pseudomonas proteolytica]TWR72718.1 hypothetical protein FIV38_27735 [Pseudomonas proteolytica]
MSAIQRLNGRMTPGRHAHCRSWLACDGIGSVCQVYRGDAIAGKPAPTGDRVSAVRPARCAVFRCAHAAIPGSAAIPPRRQSTRSPPRQWSG